MARILVIEADDQVRRTLRRALGRAGYRVLEARDGGEALRLHRDNPADLVITDIRMPEVDGSEVIAALRRLAPRLKLIGMFADDHFRQSDTQRMADRLGAFANLPKPVDLEALLEMVKLALAK